MDLKSMLNGEVNNRPAPPPPLHTPQTSSHERATSQTPSYELKSAQPTPYARPAQSLDTRSPGSGGYFNIQSPHPSNSASTNTPSASHHSAYGQSPSSYNQTHTPRENLAPQYVPSPSPSGPQPPTPSQYHQQLPPSGSYHQPGLIPHSQSSHSPHSGPPFSQNHNHRQVRQISPQAHFQQPPGPVTPLGPPLSYSKSSPQVQRPPSQGYDHYRTSSLSSVTSAHSQDYSQNQVLYHEQMHRENIQRQQSLEDARFRERSIESVSPKTIPKPTPSRSISGYTSQGTPAPHNQLNHSPAAPQQLSTTAMKPVTYTESFEPSSVLGSPPSQSESHTVPLDQFARPATASAPQYSLTPKSTHSQLPAQQSPSDRPRNGLKRNASTISSSSASGLPPRKRLRREDIPMYARSNRRKRPRFQETSNMAPPRPQGAISQAPLAATPAQLANGHVPVTASIEAPIETSQYWESAITNEVPYEDLVRRICDWIVETIGVAAPPSGGAVFEIEAKIGAIVDTSEGGRVRLPVDTETIFAKDRFGRRSKFGSSMDMHQHKQLNEFLNGLVQQSMKESQLKKREIIHYSHPKENDDFYELTQEGLANLPPSVQEWTNPHRHKPRVRRTTDRSDGALKAQIIKTRIADLEVYNPQCDFDYRISISIESPWNGSAGWLIPVQEDGGVRDKDRMSYRHLAYQIDLTQVATKTGLEHELEVEISTEQVRLELENLQAGRPSHYERLVTGFINNVRVLCRQGTIRR